jgi:hypothetical protein
MSHPPRHTPAGATHRTLGTPRSGAVLAVLLASLVAGCASPAQLNFNDGATQNHAAVDSSASPADPGLGDSVGDAANNTEVSGSPDIGGSEASSDGMSDDGDSSTQTTVGNAFERLLAGWTACFHRPSRCDAARLTAPNSPERQRLTEALAYYTAENIRTKPDEGRLQWAIESLSITSDDRARITACEYDSRIFFDSSMADTEIGDIIFDTTIWTRRVEWTLAKADDSWSLWQRRIERLSPVARFCTP